MKLRHLVARAALALALAASWSPDAHAGKDPLRRAYAGRAATLSGAVGVGAGLTLMGVGKGLGVYAYEGPWYQKAAYDRAYLRREPASEPVFWTGVGIGASAIPVVISGALVEGYGLRKVTKVSVVPGWIGMNAIALAPILAPIGPAGPYAAIGVAGLGLTMSFVQIGLNARAADRLGDADFDRLYGPRARPVVVLVPLVREGGAGVAVAGAF